MGERISNFQAYRMHVEGATSYLDRASEVKRLQQCGDETWALALRAFLVGHQKAGLLLMDRVEPKWYLCKVDEAHEGTLWLDEFCLVEYDRLRRNVDAAKLMVVEDCT